MPYLPTQAPSHLDTDGLRKWTQDEFFRIAQATAIADVVQYKVTYAEPDRLVEGMTVFADGTRWNPGAGRGLYQRIAAAWIPLFGGGGGGGASSAASVTFSPTGNVSSTNVQAAITELDNEKEPKIAAGLPTQFLAGDKTWQIPSGGGGGIPEAPNDTITYGRNGGTTSWIQVLKSSGDVVDGGNF